MVNGFLWHLKLTVVTRFTPCTPRTMAVSQFQDKLTFLPLKSCSRPKANISFPFTRNCWFGTQPSPTILRSPVTNAGKFSFNSGSTTALNSLHSHSLTSTSTVSPRTHSWWIREVMHLLLHLPSTMAGLSGSPGSLYHLLLNWAPTTHTHQPVTLLPVWNACPLAQSVLTSMSVLLARLVLLLRASA